MLDAGKVVASLELNAEGYMRGMDDAVRAARSLSGSAVAASGDVRRLSAAMGTLRRAAKEGAQGAADAMSGMSAVGRAAVNGLIRGAAGRRGALVAAFRSLARSAVQAARAELGIASPSRVFARIGRYAADGFIQGVDAGAGGARASMQRLVSAGAFTSRSLTGAGASYPSSSVVNNNHYGAPVTVTFPGAVVRSDNDIRDLERRTQKIAQDLQYGLGAR